MNFPLGEEHLLGERVPAGRRAGEVGEQPALLLAAEDRPARVEPTGLILIAAVLTSVEHVHVEQVAERRPAEELDVEAARDRRAPQRHVLVVRLEGRCTPGMERVGRLQRGVLGDLVRPVVVDLVVVEHDQPGERGVARLEVGIAPVLGVPVAVLLEGDRLARPLVHPDRRRIGRALVDAVAHLHDEIEVLLCHVPVRREVAVRVRLARGQGEGKTIRGCADSGSGAGAAGRGHVAHRAEAVPVPGSGTQAADLDVDTVAELGSRQLDAAPHDAAEAVVAGDLPQHSDGSIRHATAHQRVGCESGPEHDTVRCRSPEATPRVNTSVVGRRSRREAVEPANTGGLAEMTCVAVIAAAPAALVRNR